MKLLFFIFVHIFILIFLEVEGWHHHYPKKGGQRRSLRRDNEPHRQRVKFPSGRTYAVMSPQTSSMKDCPGKATFVKLSPKSNKWRKEYEIVKKELEKMHSISFPSFPPKLFASMADFGPMHNMNPMIPEFQGFQYLRIEKVFNPCLWYKYKYRKNQIYDETHKVNERMLFHASSAPFVSANSGLDERYSNNLEKGALGAGLYFSNDPRITHHSTKHRDDGTRAIMLCRVTLGKTNYTTSAKVAHAPVGFNSVGSKHGLFTEYSIYRGEQAYPDYVITYIPN